jgi:hypothetical protein
VSDDIVDRAGNDPDGELEAWRRCSLGSCPDRDSRVALAWADTLPATLSRCAMPSS